MRQMKLLGLVAMALLALSGVIVPTALAADELPNILPDTTGFPLTGSLECLGPIKFGTELIKLTTQKEKGCVGTQEQSNSMTGTVKITFLGVKDSIGRSCSTKGAAKGEVLLSSTFDTQAYLNAAKELKTAITLRPTLVMDCGALEITVKGCVAGQLTPENLLTKSLTLTFAVTGSDNVPVVVLTLGATTTEKCEFLARTDAGVFGLASLEGVIDVSKFKQFGKEVEVLVMPL